MVIDYASVQPEQAVVMELVRKTEGYYELDTLHQKASNDLLLASRTKDTERIAKCLQDLVNLEAACKYARKALLF